MTQRHFLDEGVFEAIGRDDVGFPTYIYLVNRLYQKGIHANMSLLKLNLVISKVKPLRIY